MSYGFKGLEPLILWTYSSLQIRIHGDSADECSDGRGQPHDWHSVQQTERGGVVPAGQHHWHDGKGKN